MVEAQETALEFLIPDEQFAEAIEPAVRDLHDPAPGALGGIAPLFLGFLPAPLDVGNVAMGFDGAKRRSAGIASVGTQVLAAPLRWRGTLHHDGVKDHGNLADIMSIGSGHDERERDATTVHQQVALAPIFFPDPSGSARRLLEPAVPSSSPRRYSAIAMRCLPARRTLPVRPAIGLRTPPLAATPESACGWRSRCRTVPSAVPSTDSPCATQKRSPRTPSAPLWVCAPRRACAHSPWPTRDGALESTVPPVPRKHPTRPTPATYFSLHVSPSPISPSGPG